MEASGDINPYIIFSRLAPLDSVFPAKELARIFTAFEEADLFEIRHGYKHMHFRGLGVHILIHILTYDRTTYRFFFLSATADNSSCFGTEPVRTRVGNLCAGGRPEPYILPLS